jgi:hypothetical protein
VADFNPERYRLAELGAGGSGVQTAQGGGFDPDRYQRVIKELENGLEQLRAKVQQIAPAVNRAVNNVNMPQIVRDAIVAAARKLIQLIVSVINKILELLRGAIAPVYMFRFAFEWQEVRGLTTGVAGALKSPTLTVDTHWKGPAADAYARIIRPQSDAAARIGAIADKTAGGLTVSAAAGLAFYVTLGVIVVKLIAATVACIAAFGSAVFSWAGVLLILEEAGINSAVIVTAVAALTAVLGVQASQMVALHGEAGDMSAFPNGRWPQAVTANFSDATVTDGDADWSRRR